MGSLISDMVTLDLDIFSDSGLFRCLCERGQGIVDVHILQYYSRRVIILDTKRSSQVLIDDNFTLKYFANFIMTLIFDNKFSRE